MKKLMANFFVWITCLIIISTGCKKNSLKVGQYYRGGIVYYVDPSGNTGYIVDSADLDITNWEQAEFDCSNDRNGGYSDWHLPSREELDHLYQYQKRYDTTGRFLKFNYWSAAELPGPGDEDSAYYQNFKTGVQSKAVQSALFDVRAVRDF